MQDSYIRGVAALADHYRIDGNNVFAHHEWAPGRKVDPAGPSRFGSVNGSGSWDMNLFRQAVHSARGGGGPAPKATQTVTAPAGTVYVVKAGDSWWSIATNTIGDPANNWKKLADLNGGEGRILQPGQVLQLPGGGAAPSVGAQPATGGVPAFPGVAQRPDSGPVVLAWQQALIAKGVIRDNADNRDSQYGDGLYKAVLRLQQSWGWSDADGVAGKHTWRKLHGGS
jgi:LysM repeat protein